MPAGAKSAKYFGYVAESGFFNFWLRRDIYGQERRRDGFFVLRTNHLELAPEAIWAATCSCRRWNERSEW